MPTINQIQTWNEYFSRIERVDDYQKLKNILISINNQLEELDEAIPQFKLPNNPRNDAIQIHCKNKYQMLKKQKIRLEEKLIKIEKQIKDDISLVNKDL